MTARELLRRIAQEYGVEARESWDTDMDILLPEGKYPVGLRLELKSFGFRVMRPEYDEEFGMATAHVHAPHRKDLSWYDRGWDWEMEDTKEGLPGEAPYFSGDYLGRPSFSEN